ncbi:hypothetical protein SAMN05428979_2717 [Stappia sp. ES.058]|nr:hypothetical protein SAMN05428979_2717 [Stappia sp. ES.058]
MKRSSVPARRPCPPRLPHTYARPTSLTGSARGDNRFMANSRRRSALRHHPGQAPARPGAHWHPYRRKEPPRLRRTPPRPLRRSGNERIPDHVGDDAWRSAECCETRLAKAERRGGKGKTPFPLPCCPATTDRCTGLWCARPSPTAREPRSAVPWHPEPRRDATPPPPQFCGKPRERHSDRGTGGPTRKEKFSTRVTAGSVSQRKSRSYQAPRER